MSEAISVFFPSIAALAFVSIVVIITNQSKKPVQFQVLAVALAAAAAYLRGHSTEATALVQTFKSLSEEIRFAVSILVITVVYFGGSLYLKSGDDTTSDSKGMLDMPSLCDSVTTFDVPSSLPKDDKVLFEQSFERFRKEIVADLPTIYEMPDEAVKWVDRMIEYTVAGGKMNRGLALMAVQQTLAQSKGRELSNKERLQSAALGWCVEWLQAFFLVADDVMDASVTRRGNPCWYRLPEVKLIAINDSFILESCVYKILKRYFGTEAYYPQLVDLFLEVTRQTEFGQLLDLTSQPQTSADGSVVIDLNRFTMARYSSIVRYKTAFYSFYLPVALGMIISGVKDKKQFDTAREILLIMGEYFQVQDDYLDCYGTPEVIGKVGTDIQDNKCSWLVVQALLIVSAKQRAILEENYGRHGDANVRKVKDLYNTLGMEDIFKKYEEKSYNAIRKLLDEVKELPTEVFEFLLRKIYKRAK